MKPIVIVIPSEGFDPTEVAIPWQHLKQAGYTVRFATPNGQPGAADELMVSGEGLDIWANIPVLNRFKLFGLMLRANGAARAAYARMLKDADFQQPLRYADLTAENFDGVVFPGGHDKRIKPYLESEVLRAFVRQLFDAQGNAVKPVAAICHGVLVLARTTDATGKSVVHGRQLTSLPWSFERKAWQLGRIVRFWDPHYYRTYMESGTEPTGYWGVQQELTRLTGGFSDVKAGSPDALRKTSGMHRDSLDDARAAWVVQDGQLLTARWPGDAHTFAKTFAGLVDRYRAA